MAGVCVCAVNGYRPDTEPVAAQDCHGHVAFEFPDILSVYQGFVPVFPKGSTQEAGIPPGGHAAEKCRDNQA